MSTRHQIDVSLAEKIADWVKNRGGVQIWENVNLSTPGREWMVPNQDKDGQVSTAKPHWSAGKLLKTLTRLEDFEVMKKREVKRLHVGVKRGSGVSYVLTDGSTRRVKEAEKKYSLIRCSGCGWQGHTYQLKSKKFKHYTAGVCSTCKTGERLEDGAKAWHEFDYERQDALIYVEDGSIPLEEYAAETVAA